MIDTTPISATDMPPGDYAIVEALGHRTLIGRVTEIERFGTKMLQVEPLFCDVIAHLALMRGDEHMFWKRSNQHPPYRPEAGL